jgi:hypothetical protein
MSALPGIDLGTSNVKYPNPHDAAWSRRAVGGMTPCLKLWSKRGAPQVEEIGSFDRQNAL